MKCMIPLIYYDFLVGVKSIITHRGLLCLIFLVILLELFGESLKQYRTNALVFSLSIFFSNFIQLSFLIYRTDFLFYFFVPIFILLMFFLINSYSNFEFLNESKIQMFFRFSGLIALSLLHGLLLFGLIERKISHTIVFKNGVADYTPIYEMVLGFSIGVFISYGLSLWLMSNIYPWIKKYTLWKILKIIVVLCTLLILGFLVFAILTKI